MEHAYDMEYHQARMLVVEEHEKAMQEQMRPCVLFKPHLFIERKQWYAVYGKPFKDEVEFCAGMLYSNGNSPEEAMKNFDMAFRQEVCW